MSPTVSIIVPVYNAGKTIGRCIDSILNQEYKDFELLLVDDGSTDDSGAICDARADRDSRVRVFHQANAGVSASRNLALDHAKGTYLQFLDSDDWITTDATRSLVRGMEGGPCDMVVSDFYRVVGDRVSQKGDIEEDGIMTREEYAAHMMENPADFYYGVLWNKLYRRSIVEKHHLRMDPEISWCEDFMFNLEYIRHAQRFYALQVPIYYYVKTKGSLVNSQGLSISKTVRMKLTVFEYYQRFFKTVLDEEEYEKSRLKVYRFLVDAAGDGAVPPTILPGSTRLGSERLQVSPDILAGDSPLHDSFRLRKMLDRHLELVALKHDLPLKDTRLLLYLTQMGPSISRKDLADFTNQSRSSVTLSLQRLSSRELVKLDDPRREESRKEAARKDEPEKKRLLVTFLPAAEPILEDLDGALGDIRQELLTGFTEEEAEACFQFNSRIQDNIRKALS